MKQNLQLLHKTEIAAFFLTATVWLLRTWLGPSLNYLLLFSTTLFSIFYLWFGFFIFNKLTPKDLLSPQIRSRLTLFPIFSGIVMGFIVSYALIAIILGFHFFPMQQTALISAFLLLVVSAGFGTGYYLVKKRHKKMIGRYIRRAAVLIACVSLLLFTPLETRLAILFRDYPDFQKAYIEHRENPECEKALERVREERSRFR